MACPLPISTTDASMPLSHLVPQDLIKNIEMIIHDLDDFGSPHDFGVSKARFLQEYVTWMANHAWFVVDASVKEPCLVLPHVRMAF